ncbi:hypothetical protein K443DRAFT_679553 [Laccaria amethystina LaAM-08-1]|jgi:hypothetical protein|uniref:Uncharacterized protein n=1 Tax=Laccaria amethystina LaAM-08-1 TaxID=1095629 RepID=A0A0C9XQL8_9AGAR|nr:hypothetical protein K443DRAFT_679553 [Laccaria amethystina LaAM-08-1]
MSPPEFPFLLIAFNALPRTVSTSGDPAHSEARDKDTCKGRPYFIVVGSLANESPNNECDGVGSSHQSSREPHDFARFFVSYGARCA